MRTSICAHLTAAMTIAVVVTTTAKAGSPPPYKTRYGSYLCDPDDTAIVGWNVPTDCCTTNWAAHSSCNAANATDRPNILLVVADDHDYCLYGFMAGLCSKDPSVSCTSEADCHRTVDLGRCVATKDLKLCSGNTQQTCIDHADCTDIGYCTVTPAASFLAGLPLRLNDPACRNRQPQRQLGASSYCQVDGNDLDVGEGLTFDRGRAPCTDTPEGALPVLHTPHIDELARRAAVFPRAYVAGTTCKNSRRTILHGRYMRHLQWLFKDGKGTLECSRKGLAAYEAGLRKPLPKGCRIKNAQDTCGVDDSDNNSNRTCQDAHSVAWWPRKGANAPTGDGDETHSGEYKSFGFAKLEVLAEGQGGFDAALSKTGKGIGKVLCKEDADCGAILADPESDKPFPTAAMFDERKFSLYKITEAIDSTIDDDTQAQRQPFFIWFGPHLPHDGRPAEAYLNDLYPADIAERERSHYGRVSWLDAAVGGIVYHLQRACACRGTEAHSLWSNTVVLFLADQGFLLPGAKQNAFEQTQRTPLIISTPDHRLDFSEATPARVFDRELASAIDVLPTVLSYAEVKYFSGTEYREDYPHGRDLKALVTGGAWPTDGSVKRRTLSYGELGRPNVHGMGYGTDGGYPRYLINRPGLFGVCENPYNFTPTKNPDDACVTGDRCHLHPCLADGDCQWSGVTLGSCVCPALVGGVQVESPSCTGSASSSEWKRCANRPDVRCDSDEDCAAGKTGRYDDLCGPGLTCRDAPDQGSFKDFVGKSCLTNTRRCVPPGTCRPLLLKAWAKSSLGFDEVWDLDVAPDYDPDFHKDPMINLKHDSSYLPETGGKLGENLKNCLIVLKNLTQDDDVWHDSTLVACPDSLAGWR